MRATWSVLVLVPFLWTAVLAQSSAQPDWNALQDETMRHYQALLRLDTNPPGNERLVADFTSIGTL